MSEKSDSVMLFLASHLREKSQINGWLQYRWPNGICLDMFQYSIIIIFPHLLFILLQFILHLTCVHLILLICLQVYCFYVSKFNADVWGLMTSAVFFLIVKFEVSWQ